MEGFTHSGQEGGDGNSLLEHNILVEKQMPDCTGSSWDRVHVLHSSWYGVVFWICDHNSLVTHRFCYC